MCMRSCAEQWISRLFFSKQWAHSESGRGVAHKATQLLDYLTNDRWNVWKRMHFWQKQFIALSGFCATPHTHTHTKLFRFSTTAYMQLPHTKHIYTVHIIKKWYMVGKCVEEKIIIVNQLSHFERWYLFHLRTRSPPFFYSRLIFIFPPLLYFRREHLFISMFRLLFHVMSHFQS